METAGRQGRVDAEQQRVLDDFRHRRADGTPRKGVRALAAGLLLSSATGESSTDIVQGPEPFIGRVLDVLPEVTVDDFGLPGMRPEALATPEGWQGWLTEYTGREAWAEDPAGFEKVPETNFMARAAAGDTTNGYVNTGDVLDGLDVWRRQ